jgi:starch-binding outer membrane protein, SusD/RagB family
MNIKTKIAALFLLFFVTVSCDYLDIVPENTATIEDAFTRPAEARNFLFSLYSFLPKINDHLTSPQIWGTDEVVIPWTWYDVYKLNTQPNNTSAPFFDYWSNPAGHAFSYFQGIRQAYTFLEHIDNTPGFSIEERRSMKGEANFIIGYLHFCLLRQYGPTIIVDRAFSLDLTDEELFVERAPFDHGISFCIEKFDQAYDMVPANRSSTDMGRITRPIVSAIKARVLLYAASPLFNGNKDYANFKGKNGDNLISQNYDAEKWLNAIKAYEVAIQDAEQNGYGLYADYGDDAVQNYRYSMVDAWNKEIIWGSRQEWYWGWQRHSAPRVIEGGAVTAAGGNAPTLKQVELYYTENGLPIDVDPAFNYNNRFSNFTGDSTIILHRNREPRFYASIAFDRGTYLINNRSENMYFRFRERHGYDGVDRSNYTRSGYLIQKGVHPKTMFTNTQNSVVEYPWPRVRLAELYLGMAEALNEYAYGTTDLFGRDAIYYLDLVRERAGVNDVKTAWNLSLVKDKYMNQNGLRDIIQTERRIELAFEGHRIWDVRRWKHGEEFNSPVYGLNVEGSDFSSFYQKRKIEDRYFDVNSSYLWPISISELQKNPNLVQNPGY